MTQLRVFTMRAIALSLAFSIAAAAVAQTPAAAPAPAQASDKSDAAAANAEANKKRQQLKAAVEQSGELLRAGKLDAAISLLRGTDDKLPGDALVAATLGTAYELKGANGDALDWVREGIKRDAGILENSEWLHARILEAKLAIAKDPRWFDKNRVLGLDFGADAVPVAPEILPIEQGRIKGADQLLAQIEFQLTERAKYVKPPQPVLGDLYASAGYLAIAGAVSPLDDRKSKLHPEQSYERALEYGAPHADLIRKRLAKYQADFAALPPAPKEEVADYPVESKRFETPPVKSYTTWILAGAAAGVIVVVMAVAAVLDRRRRKHAEANPPPPLPDI